MSVISGGGGGYGPPEKRDPERVLNDVIDGYVSIRSARADYRVAITRKRRRIRLMRRSRDRFARIENGTTEGNDLSMSSELLVSIDIGGTFTDFVLMDSSSGKISVEKTLTTPDIVSGILDGFAKMNLNMKKVELSRSRHDGRPQYFPAKTRSKNRSDYHQGVSRRI